MTIKIVSPLIRRELRGERLRRKPITSPSWAEQRRAPLISTVGAVLILTACTPGAARVASSSPPLSGRQAPVNSVPSAVRPTATPIVGDRIPLTLTCTGSYRGSRDSEARTKFEVTARDGREADEAAFEHLTITAHYFTEPGYFAQLLYYAVTESADESLIVQQTVGNVWVDEFPLAAFPATYSTEVFYKSGALLDFACVVRPDKLKG